MKGHQSFQTVRYEIESEKLPRGEKITVAFLSDLHGYDHGQAALCSAVREEGADLVLCGGDMILRVDPFSFATALGVLKNLAGDFPVYLGLGNHEASLEEGRAKGKNAKEMLEGYPSYAKALSEAGVVTLRNESVSLSVKGIKLCVTGLNMPLENYKKPFPPSFSLAQMEDLVGKGPKGEGPLHFLLAHNPYFARTYFSWGADVTLSGHYHGGIWRLGERCIIASPYFHPFPRYGVGDFHEGNSHLFVSPGLGEHSIPLRICNPRELFMVCVKGA